jgi:DNA-binding NarL/FixJ family response regulator
VRRVRVVVVDDHEIVRAGLSSLLGRESDIDLVGMVGTGEEGLRLVDEVKPDVAIIDYSLPGMSGVELCETLTARHPDIPVIMLTTYLEDGIIEGSLRAGARAYVYKDVEGRELKRTIRAVAHGESVLDPKVTGRVMGWARRPPRDSGDQPLSIRETDVLRLVARGASNKEIAKSLGLTENSVKTYLQRAMGKLGCRSRSEAAALASKRGLL